MGGGEQKKFMQGKMQRKKIHAKKKVKKKNSCRRKVQWWLFQKVWVSFRKSEFQKSTILPGTIWTNSFWPWRKHNRTRIKDIPTLLVPFAANSKLVFSILAISISVCFALCTKDFTIVATDEERYSSETAVLLKNSKQSYRRLLSKNLSKYLRRNNKTSRSSSKTHLC